MSDFNVRSFLSRNRAERLRRLVFRRSASAVAAGAMLWAGCGLLDWSCHRVAPQAGRSSAPSAELQVRGGTLDPAGPVLLRPTISPFELTGEEPTGRKNDLSRPTPLRALGCRLCFREPSRCRCCSPTRSGKGLDAQRSRPGSLAHRAPRRPRALAGPVERLANEAPSSQGAVPT
jgi:hypothetical protein